MYHEKSILSLSAALKKHSRAIGDASSSYQQAVYDVTNGMCTVSKSALPNLNNKPANWDDLTKAYTNAGTDAIAWTNTVYVQLTSAPTSVMSFNVFIDAYLQGASVLCAKLIKHPRDKADAGALVNELNNALAQFNLVTIVLSGLVATIKVYGASTLPDAVTQLATVAGDSYTDVQFDAQQVADFQSQINNLKSDIATLQTEIALGTVAIAAGLVGAAIALPTLNPIGGVLAVVSIAAGAAVLGIDSELLVKDQNELNNLCDEMNSYSQDEAQLQTLTANYNQLSAQTTVLATSVDSISAAWNAVLSDVTLAINDINAAITEASNTDALPDYVVIQADINDALAEWNLTYNDSAALAVNMSASTNSVSIGMSSAQVAATATTNTVDIVTYVNNSFSH